MVITEDIRREIDRIFRECNKPNWDGYDAFPITDLSVEEVVQLIVALPECKLKPEDIVPSNDGAISLEWNIDKDCYLSLEKLGSRITYVLFDPAGNRNSGRFLLSDIETSEVIPWLKKYASSQ